MKFVKEAERRLQPGCSEIDPWNMAPSGIYVCSGMRRGGEEGAARGWNADAA